MPLLHTAVHFGNRSVRTPFLLYTGPLHIANQIGQSATYWKLPHFFCELSHIGLKYCKLLRLLPAAARCRKLPHLTLSHAIACYCKPFQLLQSTPLKASALQATANHCGYYYLVLQASSCRPGYCKILHCKLFHRKLLVLQAIATVAGIKAIKATARHWGYGNLLRCKLLQRVAAIASYCIPGCYTPGRVL